MCGGITWTGRTNLVIVRGNLTAIQYIGEILRPYVLPFLATQAQNYTFQYDNALAHRAHITSAFLNANNVPTLLHGQPTPRT